MMRLLFSAILLLQTGVPEQRGTLPADRLVARIVAREAESPTTRVDLIAHYDGRLTARVFPSGNRYTQQSSNIMWTWRRASYLLQREYSLTSNAVFYPCERHVGKSSHRKRR